MGRLQRAVTEPELKVWGSGLEKGAGGWRDAGRVALAVSPCPAPSPATCPPLSAAQGTRAALPQRPAVVPAAGFN